MAEDQEKRTTEMLKELMPKVAAIEQKVQEGANSSANINDGRKQPRNGDDENDAMPGLSPNGVDNQESKKSDMYLDDEPRHQCIHCNQMIPGQSQITCSQVLKSIRWSLDNVYKNLSPS